MAFRQQAFLNLQISSTCTLTTYFFLFSKRWNSPYINHFLQPDTLIPDPSNPQAWNRYSYVGNNPVNFNDPTGNKACGDGEKWSCDTGKKQDSNTNPHPNWSPTKQDDGGSKNTSENEDVNCKGLKCLDSGDDSGITLPTVTPTFTTPPSTGPNSTTLATVGWIALGVVLIGLGVVMLASGGFIVVAAVGELAAASAGEAIGAAALVEAVQGIFMGTVWYGSWGIAGLVGGSKAIENGVAP